MSRDAQKVIEARATGLFPPTFPFAWAVDWGQDRYGLWQSFVIAGVRQQMRWIVPGKYLMGSPPDEPERHDDEALHEVEIPDGFWLADTTCTQELWRAVLVDNPSDFREEVNLPVESISWDDCQKFLQKINQMVPGLELSLPTEEQWEYSCRAATTTPFSFGEQVTSAQVNFHATNPYNDGAKGEFREKTVPVKSLPCNNWGLYEMHGNVLEWCADLWREDRTEDVSIEESGEIAHRVLRGGSWFSGGRSVRSAYRYRSDPGARYHGLGVRFSRGQ